MLPKYTVLRDGDRLWPKVETTGDCWLWMGMTDRDGYGKLRDADQRHVRAHVYAWRLATGAYPPIGRVIGHTCDTRACVRNDKVGTYDIDGISYERRGHLWLATHTANIRDRDLKGRTARGEQSGARTHPEARPRGDANWVRQHPETSQGERNSHSKLTTEQVIQMRDLFDQGTHYKVLAGMFGVKPVTAWAIATRRAWRHI